ncbi:hypothetical protein B0O99DRAFT_680775 [Bisporella sp. PMI_857]|nr:hypothetical protein B0O99DRAFT_680775 [Bisporella sp. PMI_857]
MASLTNVVGILEGVKIFPLARLCMKRENHFRTLAHKRVDNRTGWDSCPSPEDLLDWHQKKMEWIRVEASCEQLEKLCSNVACYLLSAADLATELASWNAKEEHDDFDAVLLEGLSDIVLALEEFKAVARTPILRARHNLEMIFQYLRLVFEVAILLANLAGGPGVCEDILFYWTESLNTGLKGFHFDDLEDYMKSRAENRTLAGSIPAAYIVPESCLPAYPTFPTVFLNPSHYGTSILRNAMCPIEDA